MLGAMVFILPITVVLIHHTGYYNRESFHFVILQGVCDSQWCFTNVLDGWPGQVHDSMAFGHSQIGEMIADVRLIPNDSNLSRVIDNHIIEPFRIGDPAYPHIQASNGELSRQQFHIGKRTFQL